MKKPEPVKALEQQKEQEKKNQRPKRLTPEEINKEVDRQLQYFDSTDKATTNYVNTLALLSVSEVQRLQDDEQYREDMQLTYP